MADGRHVKAALLLCPTMWDAAELPHATAGSAYRVIPYGTDVSEDPASFDALAFIDEVVATFQSTDIAGVIASDDYPGSIVAAAVARALGLRGPGPERVLLFQHKYYARLAQRAVAPEAVPDFTLIAPEALDGVLDTLAFPLFVKPVKSFFSILAERVDDAHQLTALVARAAGHLHGFVRPFNQLLARYTDFDVDGSHLIAETPLRGAQVTVEACVAAGQFHLIGITDSGMYPGTMSFERFDYPSSLPADVQRRMATLAARIATSVDFTDSLFNVEMFYDAESGHVSIIEVNPRMCPQFADLMEKVNGVNTYRIALDIATGARPTIQTARARYGAATSFVFRRFRDARVERVPSPDEIAELHARFPDARLKILCRPGHRLSEELQDGKSYRYALLHLGGASREDIDARMEEAWSRLTFVFDDV